VNISEKIIIFIENHFCPKQKITENTDLFGERIIDSIGIVELVSFLQEEFDVSVPFESISMNDFKNIDSMSAYIKQLKS